MTGRLPAGVAAVRAKIPIIRLHRVSFNRRITGMRFASPVIR
jgi:hypothetical protein